MDHNNVYLPIKSKIMNIIQHTEVEYTFRLAHSGSVKPGQFFEVSIPKYGECPISVSGIGTDFIDFTIRRVGKVTDELHKFKVGDAFFIRGPYGNGFDIDDYQDKEVIVVAGGSGLAPVKGIIDIIYRQPKDFRDFNLLVGFKSPEDILFKDELKDWSKNLKVTLTVDRASEGYKGNVGLVTQYVEDIGIKSMDDVAVIIVGPPMMMKFTVEAFLKRGIAEEKIWVSYERKMHCGIGKCGHCRMDDSYICLDGPVYNFSKAKHLYD